jgi:hypothetical protein
MTATGRLPRFEANESCRSTGPPSRSGAGIDRDLTVPAMSGCSCPLIRLFASGDSADIDPIDADALDPAAQAGRRRAVARR